jgi:hypothetical protein
MMNLKKIIPVFFLIMMLPLCVMAYSADVSDDLSNELSFNMPANDALNSQEQNCQGAAGLIKGLKERDNGVTLMNDGDLQFKFSGYADREIMKYVMGMGCALPRKLSMNASSDGMTREYELLKTPSDGFYVKPAIRAEKDSNIFILATTGLRMNPDSETLNDDLTATSDVILGGGIGYFLKNHSMQLGYDNKVGVSASLGIVW